MYRFKMLMDKAGDVQPGGSSEEKLAAMLGKVAEEAATKAATKTAESFEAKLKELKLSKEKATNNSDGIDTPPGQEDVTQMGVPALLRKWCTDTDRWHGKGLSLARVAIAIAKAAKEPGSSVLGQLKTMGCKREMEMLEGHAKALSATSATAGGTMVPPNFIAEVIEILYTESVVRKAAREHSGRALPLLNGNVDIPRLTGGATAYYGQENAATTPSEQSTGDLKLNSRELTCLVPISDRLLAQAGPAAELMVRDDMVRVMALREDRAFLVGTGSSDEPEGLFNQVIASQQVAVNAATNLDTVIDDLDALDYLLDAISTTESVPDDGNRVIFAHPRVKKFLKGLQTLTGDYRFRKEIEEGKLNGHAVYWTPQIPINGGVGGKETKIGQIWMPDVIIGDEMGMEMEVFRGGSYESGGNTYSGISRRQTVVRCVSRHDLGLRHQTAGAVKTGCNWGG